MRVGERLEGLEAGMGEAVVCVEDRRRVRRRAGRMLMLIIMGDIVDIVQEDMYGEKKRPSKIRRF